LSLPLLRLGQSLCLVQPLRFGPPLRLSQALTHRLRLVLGLNSELTLGLCSAFSLNPALRFNSDPAISFSQQLSVAPVGLHLASALAKQGLQIVFFFTLILKIARLLCQLHLIIGQVNFRKAAVDLLGNGC
jgi:hypothetical protein